MPGIRRRRGRLALTALVAASLLAAAGTASAGHTPPSRTTDLRLLALNDLHGNLEEPQGSAANVTEIGPDGTTSTVPAGGIEHLATRLRAARAENPNSLTVAAGDLIGASPLLSGLFHDEPTIEALNKLGLDVTSVGNHEFDEGRKELRRMQNGGCHPTEGCYTPGRTFRGADFEYLAANVLDERTGLPILAPASIENVGGARVGFIGLTLEGTPDIVTAEGVAGLKFQDEIRTANRIVPWLRLLGVESIVVLLHEGGLPAGNAYNYDCNAGGNLGLSGPVVDIAKGLDPAIDVVVTGHTHQAYTCDIPDPAGKSRMVTSASSFGKVFTQIDLTYDKRTRDIVRGSVKAQNHVVRRTPDRAPDMTTLLNRWRALAAPVANRPIGHISADILGRGSTAPETPLGDLLADAQLEATAPADKGGAQIAFMNPGGIRSDFQYAAAGAEGDGVVTYGEAFTVQPFTNMLVTVDLTGQAILDLLAQQYTGGNAASPRILQVSAGLTYTTDRSRTGAARIVAGSVALNGVAIDPAATYKVTANEFLTGGGDGFAAFKTGTNKRVGGSDLDALTAYFAAHSSAGTPIAPPAADRITFIG